MTRGGLALLAVSMFPYTVISLYLVILLQNHLNSQCHYTVQSHSPVHSHFTAKSNFTSQCRFFTVQSHQHLMQPMMRNAVVLRHSISLMLFFSNWWTRADEPITNGKIAIVHPQLTSVTRATPYLIKLTGLTSTYFTLPNFTLPNLI